MIHNLLAIPLYCLLLDLTEVFRSKKDYFGSQIGSQPNKRSYETK